LSSGSRSPIIFAFYIAGSANEAAALGVILILVAALTTAVVKLDRRHRDGRGLRLEGPRL